MRVMTSVDIYMQMQRIHTHTRHFVYSVKLFETFKVEAPPPDLPTWSINEGDFIWARSPPRATPVVHSETQNQEQHRAVVEGQKVSTSSRIAGRISMTQDEWHLGFNTL